MCVLILGIHPIKVNRIAYINKDFYKFPTMSPVLIETCEPKY